MSFGACGSCGNRMELVPGTGMCGPCTFGEADTIDGGDDAPRITNKAPKGKSAQGEVLRQTAAAGPGGIAKGDVLLPWVARGNRKSIFRAALRRGRIVERDGRLYLRDPSTSNNVGNHNNQKSIKQTQGGAR